VICVFDALNRGLTVVSKAILLVLCDIGGEKEG
jgi:hypothetical protein